MPVRAWGKFAENIEDLPADIKLISDIQWAIGTDKKGRTLYHYSWEEAQKLLADYTTDLGKKR